MQIQVNTDNHIEGREALVTYVQTALQHQLRHVSERLTRVEVHLADENGGKSGVDDKRCTLEARLRSHQPVAVSHHAGNLHEALDGAARKLKSALDATFGRLQDKQLHSEPPAIPDDADATAA